MRQMAPPSSAPWRLRASGSASALSQICDARPPDEDMYAASPCTPLNAAFPDSSHKSVTCPQPCRSHQTWAMPNPASSDISQCPAQAEALAVLHGHDRSTDGNRMPLLSVAGHCQNDEITPPNS